MLTAWLFIGVFLLYIVQSAQFSTHGLHKCHPSAVYSEIRSLNHDGKVDLINRLTRMMQVATVPFILKSAAVRAAETTIMQVNTISDIPDTVFTNLDDVAVFVAENCQTALAAYRSSGRALYRGSQSSIKNGYGVLTQLTPDLLNNSTYNAHGAATADYFRSLDQEMSKQIPVVRPAKAHLATPNIMAASQWGNVQLVFPIDNSSITAETAHFAWLRKQQDWWYDAFALPQSMTMTQKPAFFWKNREYLRQFLRSNVIVDGDLALALNQDKEILFSSGQIVAVPVIYEAQLLKKLQVTAYSESVSVRRATQNMEIEGDVRRSRIPRMQF